MTALADHELERNGDLVWHPDRNHGIGLYYESGRPATKKLAEIRPHVRLCGPLGGQILAGPGDLRREARRLLDAADTLEARLRPELHPDRPRYAKPLTLESLAEVELRPAVFYYAVRLILADGLDAAQEELASRRSKLTPEQIDYVLERLPRSTS